ncbi:MAG: hypothetical protein QM256_10060 [Pseudomonadota bacterium]|jgi:hypothetical protein|nr:hypothetical protein [Pseudomonadota bacterium]NLX31381.1 hypothetical protein [Deltaproteobacteria bacterium]HNU86580.1 hypothetical protein [Syntrophales bacterium]HOF74788.1 hypothetical protein [Syntrophales bacterium]HPV54816.1 hypothetical protein [Syntrophales bacterium]
MKIRFPVKRQHAGRSGRNVPESHGKTVDWATQVWFIDRDDKAPRRRPFFHEER